MKYKDELAECRTRGLDRCHKSFKELGFGYFLFVGTDRMGTDLIPNEMRHYEWIWFHLIQPTLNSQYQQGSFVARKLIP